MVSARFLGLWALALLVLLLVTGCKPPAIVELARVDTTVAGEATGPFSEFSIPTRDSLPQIIIAGPDGALWFTQGNGNRIGRITVPSQAGPDGRPQTRVTEFSIPTAKVFPQGMTIGPDGAIYFTQRDGNKIGRFDPKTGKLRQFELPTPNSWPIVIVVGPDRRTLWTVTSQANAIVRFDPKSGKFKEFKIPTPNSVPLAIITGPDGALWFTEEEAHKLGRFDPKTEKFEEFSTPTPNSGPLTVVLGPDGALWFTEADVSQIGRFDLETRKITEFKVPTPNSGPAFITVGSDNALWFTEFYGNKIGRLDPKTGEIREFPVALPLGATAWPDPGDYPDDEHRPTTILSTSGPATITSGPDGALWFTEMWGSRIGRIVPPGQ